MQPHLSSRSARTRSAPGLAAAALVAFLLPLLPSAQDCDGLGVVKLPEADAAPALSGGEQEFPAIAAGGGVYLSAWPDDRSHFGGHTTGQGSRDVYARRLASDGTPIEAVPFRVAGGLGRKKDVRVAWNGSEFFVAWLEVRPSGGFKALALVGARVSFDGVVLDPEPIVVRAYAQADSIRYALASDGNGWAAVCQGSSAGEAVVEGHLIAADGTVSAGPAPVFTSTSLWFAFELGFANGKYLLAAGSSNTQGRFLGPDLAPLGNPFLLASGPPSAKIATDGSGFLVAYASGAFVGSQIFVRTVSSSGFLGVPQAVTPSGVEYAYDPAVAWTGAGYVVAYTHDLASPTEVRLARVSAAGAVMDFGGLPAATGTDARNPQIASLGDGSAQIAWVRNAGLEPYVSDVLSTHVDAAGATAPAQPLANGRPRQGDPDLADGGSGYLSVFTSESGGATRILAHRLDRFGNPLDPEPIEVASGPNLAAPRAAWNGQSFLVVWEDPGVLSSPSYESDDAILGRRVGQDGALLDAAPIPMLQGNMPDVAAVGSTFLVVASTPVTTEIRRIFGVRVDASGALLDAAPKQIGGNFARWPTAGAFDDRWIVAWQRNPTHDDPSTDVRYAVVLASGSSLGEVPVAGGTRPSVAASDAVGLFTFGGGNEARALRVAKDGAPLGDIFALTAQPNGQLETATAWTGQEFVVAWEDERAFEAFFDDRRDVYATRVLEDGSVLAFDGCPVSVTPNHDQMPTVAGRDGDYLIAFAKHAAEAPAANVRIAYARGSEWTGIEGGIAGAAGTPVLEADGALVPSGALEVALAGAAPLAPAVHVVGLSRIDLPLLGGVLVPLPDVVIATATGPAGGVLTAASLPATLPPGFQLWIQSFVLDAAAPQGVSASNAIEQ